MKFLVRLKSRHHDDVRMVTSFAAGAKLARDFVGDHMPEDGCSSPAQECGCRIDGIEGLTVARSTSFGERRGSVQPLFSQKAVELL